MEIHVDKGRGYVSAEENKTEHMPIGVLPVDSIIVVWCLYDCKP